MACEQSEFRVRSFGRMEKTINGTVTQFLYDGLNPVQTLVSGTPNANILTGLGIDEYFQWTDSSGAMSFLSDALGSTLALADSTGTMQTTYNYDPFGATSINYFQSSNSNPFQFTGRENDWPNLCPELYYYRARYYNPMFQRFISQDPLDFVSGSTKVYLLPGGAAGLNLLDFAGRKPKLYVSVVANTVQSIADRYSYGGDDPVDFGDPFGACGPSPCPQGNIPYDWMAPIEAGAALGGGIPWLLGAGPWGIGIGIAIGAGAGLWVWYENYNCSE
jgi:RHS repeat-associated protein